MRSTYFVSVCLMAGLLACQTGTAPETEVARTITRNVKEVVIASGTPVVTADLSIEGMTCEFMCGGAIKEALTKLNGVAGTAIEYQEGEDIDHAIVTYDPEKVNEDQMIEAVQALHEGQYKVMAVEVTRQVLRAPGSASEEGAEETTSSEGQVSAALQGFVVPSLLELLSQIVRS
ncbi:MAG: heavy-metal-associated domain-containing protein [Flavobacteriales bacterium]|nr:heavy-metal-associated domain-containing protein [Flavobacteriales bacterium]MCB9170450.1 heavy-metal-associated domain-containing protein [Flavobacteriales bacterium]